MYFILSKLLLFVLSPFYWGLALLIAALVIKNAKRKKSFLIAAIALLYFFSTPFSLKSLQYFWDVKPYPAIKNTKYSCAIVLGGFSSGVSKNDGHFNSSADRFIQGVKLFKTGQVSHILISGGTGELIPDAFREAAWVRTQLLQLNIADSAIIVENKSKNTIENAKFSKMLLKQKGLPPPYLLVTSAFHMRRAQMIFEKAGVSVVPYACNYLYGKLEFNAGDLAPEAATLGRWEFYTKEVVGYVVNYFKQ